MRVKIHKQIETLENRFRQKTYQEEVRDVIYTQLVAFENQSKEKTDVCKIREKKSWPTLFSFMLLILLFAL
jgi:hypothetical protein